MKRLTRLRDLQLHNNPALEKPPGCPLDKIYNDMRYTDEKKVAAFLRCLPSPALREAREE